MSLGHEEIAVALGARTITPQIVRGAFDRPSMEVPRYAATVRMSTAPVRFHDFGKASAAQVDDGFGYPTFAELLVTTRLRAAGWTSVWASRYGGLKWIQDWPWNVSQPTRCQLPARVMDRLSQIAELRREKQRKRKVSFDGIPDVIAWRQDDLVMIECKRAKKDTLGLNQEAWMHCAILSGYTIEQLGVFEWRAGTTD